MSSSRFLSFMMVLTMLLSLVCIRVQAEETADYTTQYIKVKDSMVLLIGNPNAIVKMEKKKIDSQNDNVSPMIKEGRTLVPVRFIAESLGAEVTFDATTSTITITTLDKVIKLVLNSNDMDINGTVTKLDVPAQSIEGRTMIPLRAMVEGIGKKVFWDPKGMIIISDTDSILSSNDDTAFIDNIISVVKTNAQLPNIEVAAGPIFDTKRVGDVVDFEKVEEPYYLREALPNFNIKISSKKDIRVAFIGGSITTASGYRTLTSDWLSETYGDKFTFLDAGVGGTGSEFGAVRLQTDVISFKPDLVFVEFAVNDGGSYDIAKNDKTIIKSMEGIVRQLWKADPNIDICFVYTLTDRCLVEAAQGKYTGTAKIHDYIANYYGIPSVFMGYDAAKQAVAGKIIFNGSKPDANASGTVFSGDGVHPNADGSNMYFDILGKALKEVLAKGQPKVATAHEIKSPLISSNWGDLKSIDPTTVTYTKGFKKMDSSGTEIERIWGWRAPYAFAATKVGESLTVKFNGTQAGILYLPGPDAPCIDIIIDS